MSHNFDQLELRLLDRNLHRRGDFSCGEASLDEYLQHQATQDMRRRAAVAHVLADTNQPQEIIGYFTLANAAIHLEALPEEATKQLARYPQVPATLIGRLAIATTYQGGGYGGELLRRAPQRCLEASNSTAS